VRTGVQTDAEVSAPLYARAASILREQILARTLAPEGRLPGEAMLAQQLEVSRPTIRGALACLQREGLIVTRQGVGSFVVPKRVHQTLAHLETLDTTLAEQGLEAHTRIVGYEFCVPDRRFTAALKLSPDDEVLLIKRLHIVQQEPIAHVLMCLPSHIGVHFSRRDVEQQALYELVPQRLGIRIGPATQSVRAESATPDISAALDVAEGTPVLVCERVTCSDAYEPIIYARFHYRADLFEFRATLSAHEWRVPWSTPGLVRLAPEGDMAESHTSRP
jgi:GntR family transcriptional regulator